MSFIFFYKYEWLLKWIYIFNYITNKFFRRTYTNSLFNQSLMYIMESVIIFINNYIGKQVTFSLKGIILCDRRLLRFFWDFF